MGSAVVEKLKNHKVNCEYVQTIPDGMGTWLVVFDNSGDVAGSISKRPIMRPLIDILEEKGDEIFSNADSIVLEVDLEKELVKKVLELGKKHNKKLFGLVSNMSLAVQRRDFIKQFDCLICNQLEAGILFADDYSEKTPEELCEIISNKVSQASFPALVVTMGGEGSVYADYTGEKGICPPRKVQVKDTTGAGDAFCAGVAAAMTYGKTLAEAVEIGTMLAASVITSTDNVCPRFQPRELGIDVEFD
jgi:pseudouridine kinase